MRTRTFAPAFLAVLLAPLVAPAAVTAATDPLVHQFSRPLLFEFGSWKGKARAGDGGVSVAAPDGRGGGGVNVQLDLSAAADHSPALSLTVNPANKSKSIRVVLRDGGERTATFRYDLTGRPTAAPLVLLPVDGASLASPNDAKAPLDLSAVTQVQLQGDWAKDPVDVTVARVALAPPTPDLLAQRKAKSDRDAKAADDARRAKAAAVAAIRHTDSSPAVVHVAPVDRHILAVTIDQGVLERPGYRPYVAEPGDRVVDSEGEVLTDMNGTVAKRPQKRTLRRTVDGREKDVGLIAGGRDGRLLLLPFEAVRGEALEPLTADDPASYRVRSPDDPAYATAAAPARVHRKSKPTNRAYPGTGQTVRHVVYLELPAPLVDGRTYAVEFAHVNTRQPSVTYKHDTRAARSEAVHVQQVGYRPDDPHKRAFLSVWLGTGGPHAYDGVEQFELIDGSGKAVFTGAVERVLAADGTERVRVEKNLSKTNVYAMDFSAFAAAGEYRVHVPGVGTSYPFRVADDAWAEAFRASMHGFLAQRSGVALGPPVTEFRRPRDLHPADGVRVFQSTAPLDASYAAGNWFAPLIAGRTEAVVPDAWGGYHDAGDYDRLWNHLWATYLHLELLDLFPAHFEAARLALPADEADDKLPDVLNEALWNTELFRRTQRADGGVSGGVDSAAHPRPGEASFADSLAVMAFAPDTPGTFTYAAVAARVARVAAKYDPALAERYRQSAVAAWRYGEANLDAGRKVKGGDRAVADAKNVAAAELLWLTRDPAYDRAFADTTQVTGPAQVTAQQGGAFAYARLPDGVGDAGLKAACRDKLLSQADAALAYAAGNAFGLTVESKDMPLIGPVGAFTVPGMNSQVLPRAHYLSGDAKYLAGAVRACDFSLGANPDNLTMTTGVGDAAPRAPLHFDSRYTGQDPPAGLTMYGPYDADSLPGFAKSSDWVHDYFLNKTMVPASRSWPTTESYVDFFLWPMMNEFTIKQTMGPTSYFWGYLAARPPVR